jgi:hypothetical protein
MQCPSCGTNNPPNSPFCGGCGKKMETKDVNPAPAWAASSGDNTSSLIGQSLAMAQDVDEMDDADEMDDTPEAIPEPSRAQDAFTNLRQAANRVSEQARPLVQRAVDTANTALSSPPGAASSSPAQPAPARTPAASPPVQMPAQVPAPMPTMPVASYNVRYEYSMAQVPPNIEVRGRARGQEAANYLQEVCNQYGAQGWEFYRVDTIGVLHSPGCLAALFGQRSVAVDYYVITFRRPR